MTAFSKLLIANRGEIACRIIQSAASAGYSTTAVYSDADADAPHVAYADHAVRIGPAPATESYLDVAAILEAAKATGSDAIHPGYGFLAENAEFAEACAEAGIVFVGPPPEAIRVMGDKARAKAKMQAAGVPTVPGFLGTGDEGQDPDRLVAAAADVGYPLLVKAVAGGGGRGMRRVDEESQLRAALESARREAENAFSNGDLMLERIVTGARHIEVQVFADTHGNVLHLGERDCSVQRRHQKVLEEAPSPAVDSDLRARMGEAAVAAAKAVGYVGAGTVEMLLGDDGSFYFLEMNTRLQVEHPVTEEVTRLDLVDMQLRVAAGEPLGMDTWDFDAERFGHAIEARLYAEDPYAGFLPQTGRLLAFMPVSPVAARTDAGVVEGQAVTPHYDPMIAKVIAHGRSREEARRKLIQALRSTEVLGVTTNKRFLIDILDHPTFVEGRATTDFIDTKLEPEWLERPAVEPRALAMAAMLWSERARRGPEGAWGPSGAVRSHVRMAVGDDVHEAVVQPDVGSVALGELAFSIQLDHHVHAARRIRVDDVTETVFAAFDGDTLHLEVDGMAHTILFAPPRGRGRGRGSDGTVRAPATGRVMKVHVEAGATVAVGDPLITMESMKLETVLAAPVAGEVTEVRAREGAQVDARAVVVVITPAQSETEESP